MYVSVRVKTYMLSNPHARTLRRGMRVSRRKKRLPFNASLARLMRIMSRGRILLVDDEPMVLRAMERVLSMAMTDCDILKAENGSEALALFETQPPDIVVTDMCMPNMSGSELLDAVHERHPRAARMILSARAGSEYGLSAVESAHQYFLKPGDIVTLAQKLQRVLYLRCLIPNEELDRVIAKVDTLPSLPDIYLELETEINRPESSIYAIGEILERDVAMSAKVLHLVNSAFFGLRTRISSPSHAATLLGMNLLKSLVLASHVFSAIDKNDPRQPFVASLWKHSLSVANAARKIALFEKASREIVEEAYIAGLFHDIGKLVVAMSLPDAHDRIQREMAEEDVTDVEAETAVLGASHAEVGGYLLALWGFSDEVVATAVFHGKPSRSADAAVFGALASVHAANVLSREAVAAPKGSGLPLDTVYLDHAGLSAKLDPWRDVALSA